LLTKARRDLIDLEELIHQEIEPKNDSSSFQSQITAKALICIMSSSYVFYKIRQINISQVNNTTILHIVLKIQNIFTKRQQNVISS